MKDTKTHNHTRQRIQYDPVINRIQNYHIDGCKFAVIRNVKPLLLQMRFEGEMKRDLFDVAIIGNIKTAMES